jgi:hypothetical protein
MAFIYRYIDVKKRETIYVGKVKGEKDVFNDPLRRRHEQHKKDAWYNPNSVIMQYIECESHTDVDILETWLINYYDKTGQLVNKGKSGWGTSQMDLWPLVDGKWKLFNDYLKVDEEARKELSRLLEKTDGLRKNVIDSLKSFTDNIMELSKEMEATDSIDAVEMQSRFLRKTTINNSEIGLKSFISPVYTNKSNTINSFINDRIEKTTKAAEKRDVVFNAYMDYCVDHDYPALTKQQFYDNMRQMFGEKKTNNGDWYFQGIRLNTPPIIVRTKTE